MASDEVQALPGRLQEEQAEEDPDLEPLTLTAEPSAVLVDATKPDPPPSPPAIQNLVRVGDPDGAEGAEEAETKSDTPLPEKERSKKTLVHEIEKKARSMDDRFLDGTIGKISTRIRWVAGELGLSTAEVDVHRLSQDADAKETTKACTHAFVRGAASKGKMKLLASLYLKGLWDPQKDRTAIEAADEGGFLLTLLKHFCVHLSWFPSLAEELGDSVIEELRNSPDVHGNARGEPAYHTGLNDESNSLTHRTCLLANMLLVNSPVAAKVLSAAAEEIVVFRGEHFPPVRRTHVKPFPESISTLYVKRFIKEKDAQKMKYSKKLRELWLPGSTSPTTTSATARITVPDAARESLLIPLSAEEFCFVYPCDDLPFGGFLYVDLDSTDPNRPNDVLENGRPVVVNKLGYEKGQQAFYFGEPIKLDQETTSKIQKDLQDLPLDDPLSEFGATKFAWLMTPPEPPADEEKARELNEKLKFGGFAFTFKDPEMNRVFPLTQVGAVTRMANLSWDINGCRLPLKPFGSQIEKNIAPATGDRAAPVAIMRVCTPGALHPVMLHALAYTPREDVLQTNVAKAISLAAFDRAWPFYLQQICADCLSAAGLTMVTVIVHELTRTGADHIWEWTWSSIAAYAAIGLVLLKNVLEELCKMVGYVRCGWAIYYFSGQTFLNWVGVGWGCVLLFRLLFKDYNHSWTRLALGLAGFVKWFKLVMYMRGILSLRLGIRVLPILGALREASSFIVVMLFFIAASTHFFYSVDAGTSQNIFTSFFDAYRLGFLGDFDLTEIWGENPEWLHYLGFMAISLLVMVSLTNIYIGVMSSAYDRNYDKATELFVRARASICLDISMKLRYRWSSPKAPGELNDKNLLKDEYVWFCQSETELDVTTLEDQGKSLTAEIRQIMGKEMKAHMIDVMQGSGSTHSYRYRTAGLSPRPLSR